MTIGGLVLAAGASTRMGSPKQLISWEGCTLIDRAVDTILATRCQPVVIVLGAHFDLICPHLADKPVSVTHNLQWADGMGSTIRAGVEQLLRLELGVEGILITLCDQPLVTAADLGGLLDYFESGGKAIVAANYNQTLGVPAVFAREMFPELRELRAEVGARKLILAHKESALGWDLPAAATDVDTLEDLKKLPGKDKGRNAWEAASPE